MTDVDSTARGTDGGGIPTAGGFSSRAGRWRVPFSVLLVVVSLVLTPVAVLTGVLRAEFADTQGFVSTFGPLANRPEVQDAVAARVTDELSTQIVPGLVSRTLGALPGSDALVDNPTVTEPLNAGITAIIGGRVHTVVSSPVFGSVWRGGLTVAHAQFVATMTDSPDAALSIDDNETLEVNLGPVVSATRERLTTAGVGFASWIPDVEVSIPVASGSQLSHVQTAYRAVDLLGVWAPVGAVILLAAGVRLSVARRRTVAVFAGATTVICLVLVLAVNVGKGLVVTTLAAQMSSDVLARAFYDAATRTIVLVAVLLGVAALLTSAGTLLVRPVTARMHRRAARHSAAADHTETKDEEDRSW